MIEIIHRVNNTKKMTQISSTSGIEIDIRSNNSSLILAHEPNEDGENFEDFLKNYKHKLLVLNIKEAGIEEDVINKSRARGIEDFFLLDTEFPFILNNYQKYGEYLSVRYSKKESIFTVENFVGKIKWVWVDTYEDIELDSETINILKNFNICLVSPSRWGRKEELNFFLKKFDDCGLKITGLMIEKDEKVH
ncbi:hypothetical protein N8812_02005 [Acidimicrobiia bacterium]|nr:hypothetical protein [Acidimicrobiia bacterium]